MERYICVHGHFYQPPRENPWLEAVEVQDTAYPYHDWNERIAAECYAPNAWSRIMDPEGRITRIVNNYAQISFNFGPTLLSWLEQGDPDTYRAIMAADRASRERFSGHGSALAQAYNHMILPLANRSDKHTQILWGMRDFEHRFGRTPEGMWLPETAVDPESLDLMAELGLRFTVLAPHQAARTRPLNGGEWQDVTGERVDPTMPYRVNLPSGRHITVLFYEGPISKAVAFEKLLASGERFAERLMSGFKDARDGPQLVHIATDGETYGHHHRHGEMALSYALQHIESHELAHLTNYGEFLERHPPTHEAEIIERTAWSCAHGVGRWERDCGCNSGAHAGWNQAWRGPLRAALDWLRDALAPAYEKEAGRIFKDHTAARNDYIGVILDRSPENIDRFLKAHAVGQLEAGARVAGLALLEMQRHALLMYTSCGWFFDELTGIETVQVIRYAGRVIQLAEEHLGGEFEQAFLARLEQCPCNVAEQQNGRKVYENLVRPSLVDIPRVCAHYAISALFEPYGEETRIYGYDVVREDFHRSETGRQRVAIGRARVTARMTGESRQLSFGVLHFGDHNFTCGVRDLRGHQAYADLIAETEQAFAALDLPAVVRLLDHDFGAPMYSLRSLFRDEQRKVIDLVLEPPLAETEAAYRSLYEHHAPLMRVIVSLGVPLQKAFLAAAELVLNADLRRALGEIPVDSQRIHALMEDARAVQAPLDSAGLGYALRDTLIRMARQFLATPHNLEVMRNFSAAVTLLPELPFVVDLSRPQNACWEILQRVYPTQHAQADAGDAHAQEWTADFSALGAALRIKIP
jgi:alpha-amylase/alpha-mannosidase (GH57 family)